MALKFWSMDADRDNERSTYVNVTADTKEEAQWRFEIILGRPLNGRYETISEDEVLTTHEEILAAAEERKQAVERAEKYRVDMHEKDLKMQEQAALRFLKERGVLPL